MVVINRKTNSSISHEDFNNKVYYFDNLGMPFTKDNLLDRELRRFKKTYKKIEKELKK